MAKGKGPRSEGVAGIELFSIHHLPFTISFTLHGRGVVLDV
jgi:hypothetical protein